MELLLHPLPRKLLHAANRTATGCSPAAKKAGSCVRLSGTCSRQRPRHALLVPSDIASPSVPVTPWRSLEALLSKVNMRKSISMQAGQPPNSPITHRIVQLIASLLILQLPLPVHALEQMYSIPKIELESNFQSVILADLDPVTAKTLIGITGPFLSGFGFLFILRIVMSWYPKLPVDKFPYVIAYAPTEPILRVTRKLITPVGGVDVTPVVWFGLLSFLNEILVGPQGLLVLLSQKV